MRNRAPTPVWRRVNLAPWQSQAAIYNQYAVPGDRSSRTAPRWDRASSTMTRRTRSITKAHAGSHTALVLESFS